MDDFLLSPFLVSLAADGIHPTIGDYQRISLALQAGGPWTITRFRDMLLSLLARDENQQVVFLQRFDEFFRLKPSAEDAFADVDVKRALVDLAQLAQVQSRPPESRPPTRGWPRQPVQKAIRKPGFKFELWMALPIILILGALVAIGYALWLPPPVRAPSFSLNPIALDFGTLSVGDTSTGSITLTNHGSDPLFITPTITGPHAADFSLAADYASQPISAGDGLIITVRFTPGRDSVGDRIAFLDIAGHGANSPQRIELKGEVVIADSPTEQKRLYANVPYVSDIQYLPLGMSTEWRRIAAIAAFFLCLTLLYGFYLWRSHRIPEDEAAHWDKDGPRHFPLGMIGGQPAPFIDDETLDQLADSMGYFQSTQSSEVLNVSTSIKATLHSGGIPTLEFQRRKQIRSLLILEDAFAEATTWNPIARELAEGMLQRGVPVLYGRFSGSPERFQAEDGSVHHLEDLEDQRRGYLLLIFTDGKGLYRRQSTFALEALARWPMVAWMELREPRLWDETSVLPTCYGIPIYPATPGGMARAVRRFLTERGADADFSERAAHWQGEPDLIGNNLNAHVEELLGDALMWAQDCAMLQPVSPGLADALRRGFHPHLPPERIERLYALPGTQHNVAGLRFSDPVLKVLRSGFLLRRDEQEQESVLRFLLQEIETAEPDETESLGHLAWEVVRERVRLELDPDNDVARLAQLAKTPLGNAVSASLENFGFPDQADRIPLRLKPRNKYALQRLARLANSLNIPRLEAHPIAWGHRLLLGMVILLSAGLAGWSVFRYVEAPPPQQYWMIHRLDNGMALQLELLEQETWQEVQHYTPEVGQTGTTFRESLLDGRDYRLTLYGGGFRTTKEFSATNDTAPLISVDVQSVELPCREEFPDIGLTVKRCLDSETNATGAVLLPTWRDGLQQAVPDDRVMSVGLEFVGSGGDSVLLEGWHNTLFRTSSIDALYQVQLDDTDALYRVSKAFRQLQTDLGPLTERSQLIWWEVGQTTYRIDSIDARILEVAGLGNDMVISVPFARILKLGSGEDLSWIVSLETLFQPGNDTPITEGDILAALEREQPATDGVPIVLGRQQAFVFIDPPAREVTVGVTTTVDVRIENVANLYGAEVQLVFDPALLEVVDTDPSQEGVQIQPGLFLSPDFLAKNNADQTTGRIVFAVAQMPPRQPVSGDGILATIVFRGKETGTSALNFSTTQPITPVILADQEGRSIVAITQNGLVTIIERKTAPVVLPSPVVHSISPAGAQKGVSVAVVISGENFTYSSALTIGVPLVATFVDSRTLTAIIPMTLEVGEYLVIVQDIYDQGDSSAFFTMRVSPTPAVTPTSAPTPTSTPWPPTLTPTIPPYPPPVLTENGIIGCNVTFRWEWAGTLAEDEWFEVRVGRLPDIPHGQYMGKEREYTYSLYTLGGERGDYVWEIAICRGEPSTAVCHQSAVSERGVFSHGGCP